MGESQIGITIVNQKEKAIYTDSKIEKNIKIKDLKDNNFGYLIFKNNGSYYLETSQK